MLLVVIQTLHLLLVADVKRETVVVCPCPNKLRLTAANRTFKKAPNEASSRKVTWARAPNTSQDLCFEDVDCLSHVVEITYGQNVGATIRISYRDIVSRSHLRE